MRGVSSLEPSAAVDNLFLNTDQENLDVLGGGSSEMFQNGVQGLNGVEADESVARVDERLHGLVVQGHLEVFHRFLECISILISIWNKTVHATWLLDAQEHLHVLQILDLRLQLKLFREIRNDEQGGDLSRSLTAVASLFEDLVEISLNTFTSLILGQDTFDVHSPCFQTLMIFIFTHILIETFKRNFRISTSLLDNSNCQECKHENYYN